MAKIQTEQALTGAIQKEMSRLSRRKFLGYAGAATGLMAALAACTKTNDAPSARTADGTIDVGSGDGGILNYAYALEQLEAAFYVQVLMHPYASMNSSEMAMLSDIRDHEIAHREFFKNALGANAIPALEFDWSKIDFTSRASVLGTSMAFEDLGVSAYNGAGHLIQSGDYLLLAGKIVSVEARHASYVRDLVKYNSFADDSIIDMNGLDKANPPSVVLPIAQTYIKTKLSANSLP